MKNKRNNKVQWKASIELFYNKLKYLYCIFFILFACFACGKNKEMISEPENEPVIDYVEESTNKKVGYGLAWLMTTFYYPIIASIVALLAGQYFFQLILHLLKLSLFRGMLI